MGGSTPEDVVRAVLDAARDDGNIKTLSCAHAHRLAHELGVEKPLVGRICDEHKVRIVACQLDLFK